MSFLIPKIWQIVKRFSGAFRQAQTPKLLGVSRAGWFASKAKIKVFRFFFNGAALKALAELSKNFQKH